MRSSKFSKTTVEFTFTTQEVNARSPQTSCSVFDWKYPFWINWVQKLKIISLSWNLVHRLIQVCRIPWRCSLFLFLTGSTFLGRCDPKNQNFQFELKFCTYNNLNMQNSMMVFTFSVLNQKNLFGVNLVHKIKIVSLSWNLVPRLIRICGIQCWCSLLLFLTINVLGQIWSKNRKLFVQSEIW